MSKSELRYDLHVTHAHAAFLCAFAGSPLPVSMRLVQHEDTAFLSVHDGWLCTSAGQGMGVLPESVILKKKGGRLPDGAYALKYSVQRAQPTPRSHVTLVLAPAPLAKVTQVDHSKVLFNRWNGLSPADDLHTYIKCLATGGTAQDITAAVIRIRSLTGRAISHHLIHRLAATAPAWSVYGRIGGEAPMKPLLFIAKGMAAWLMPFRLD